MIDVLLLIVAAVLCIVGFYELGLSRRHGRRAKEHEAALFHGDAAREHGVAASHALIGAVAFASAAVCSATSVYVL